MCIPQSIVRKNNIQHIKSFVYASFPLMDLLCAAPEILKGTMATYNGDASDVWSCGVVLLVSHEW